MVEPSDAELRAFTTVESIGTWVGLSADSRNILTAGLGCGDADSYRPIGGMTEADYEAVLGTLQVQGDAPPPFTLAAWRLVGHVSRLACGATLTRVQQAAKDAAAAASQALAQQLQAGGVPPAPQGPVQKMGITKLSTTIDQGLDDEVATALEADLTQGYDLYTKRMGKMPAEDREPSIDQFTGIRYLLSISAPPFADFSVFGPHSVRLRKRMRLGGFFLANDGSLCKCELFGPTTFPDWSRSFRVLATILIMLEAVFPEELDSYHDLIRDYSTRYGERCWPTIYQADVRCRQERMQSIRRRGIALHTADPAVAARAGFLIAAPWRYVFTEAVNDANFWLKEVQEKCLLLLTKVATPDAMLDGDVRVASGGHALPAQVGEGAVRERSPRRSSASGSGKGKGGKDAPPQKQHNVGTDGFMKTNRAGKELCIKFQNGECDKASGPYAQCPRDRNRVHQCSKCLSQDHGANHPHPCSAASRGAPATRKGGRKGKRF